MSGTQQLVTRIIKDQELVIGPLAWREAKKVTGLRIGTDHSIKVDGDSRSILAGLVSQYEGLFGPASVQVCRDAVRSLLPKILDADVPDVLK